MSQFIFPPLTASLDSEQTNGGSLPAKQIIIGGYDGSNVRAIKTDAAGELQVDISSSALPSGAATAALQTAGNNILTTIDADTSSLAGCVSGTEVQVDVVASLPAGTNAIGKLAANSGVDIGDVDVTSLPSIPTGTNSIGTVGLNTGTNSIGTVGLDSGTNAIGKLVANSGVDIGDVDVTSIVPGVAATNLGKAIQSAQGTTDTGVAALVVRNDTLADLSGADGDYTPLQVNATGALYTTIDSSALPTGAATAALQTAGNNLLTTIDADTSSLAGAVSGTEMQVDVVASLPAGTNTIGKVDVNAIAPVDFLDAGVFDASTGTNIPSTGSAELVTNLAAACTEIEVVDDIGEYMSLRAEGSGGGGYSVKTYLPLGGGRVKVSLAAGDGIKLFSETGTTINSGKIAINFLG
jgi:hypothetical protein